MRFRCSSESFAALPFLTTAIAELKGYFMTTPIGFLAIGSYITKGGNRMQVFDIDSSEVAVIDGNGSIHMFDTPVLDLQDVQAA